MNLSSVAQSEHTLFPKSLATPQLLSYRTTDSYLNEAPTLNPPRLELVQHLQGVPVEPALRERTPTTLGQLCGHFQARLADSPPARQASLQKLHRQLLLCTSGPLDPANPGKKQAKACYQYFQAAQRAFEDLAQACDAPRRRAYEEQRDLCRMLKWQYRASRDQHDKTALDQAMAKSRATVANGGSMGNHTRLGIGLGATGTVSLVPSVELSTGLSTTQGRIIKDTTSVSAGVTAKLSARVASAGLGASLEKSTTRKYGNIDDYADARSRSKWTFMEWFQARHAHPEPQAVRQLQRLQAQYPARRLEPALPGKNCRRTASTHRASNGTNPRPVLPDRTRRAVHADRECPVRWAGRRHPGGSGQGGCAAHHETAGAGYRRAV